MDRYNKTRIKLNKNSDRVYSYTLYPKIPLKNSDIFITPKYSERLDNLADKHYDDPSLWWIIAQANGIRGFTSLYSKNFKGTLRIPTEISDIVSEFESINR